MSVRAAQQQALHKLQALDICLVQPFLKQCSRQIFTASDSIHTCHCFPSSNSSCSQQQQHMTTDQPPRQARKGGCMMQQPSSCQLGLKGSGTINPSPSSSTSDCCQLDRLHAACASTKSAKRKAAEALLAARYNSSSAAAASPGIISYGVAAAGAQLQSKRHRGSLTAVIDKFEGGSGSSAAAAGPLAADSAGKPRPPAGNSSGSNSQEKPPQLAKLQQVLETLHEKHQQIQQPEQPASAQQQTQQAGVGSLLRCGKAASAAPAAGAPASNSAAGALSISAAIEQAQQHVLVPGCGTECKHSLANGWCHSQVKLPHVDWARIIDADLGTIPSFKIAQGYERIQLPDGLQILLVENAVHLQSALQQLRASMQDSIIAIDLEWRPEFGRRFTPVAMMQLASSRMAVLVRTCKMNYRLPAPLQSFLKDPTVSLVGFSWNNSDEPKMQSTFGLGCRDFGHFLDLQSVAQGLGYCSFGLARLTRHVLGLHLPKSKRVSMSNWEQTHLTRNQVKYAALDVLVAGQVFRALRLWHSSPSLCEVCHYNLGTASSSCMYSCSCGKDFRDSRGYLQHCERADHEPKWAQCSGCGCTRRLPWPSGSNTGSNASSNSSPDSSEDGTG